MPAPPTACLRMPEIQQGVAYQYDIQVWNYDLTGASVQCQIRTQDGALVLDWTTVATPVAIDATNDGITLPQLIQFRLSTAEAKGETPASAALAPGRYVYDMEVHRGGECEKRLAAGEWPVTAEVTLDG